MNFIIDLQKTRVSCFMAAIVLLFVSCSEKTEYQKGVEARNKNDWQASVTHFNNIQQSSPDYDSAQVQIEHIRNAIARALMERFQQGDYLSVIQFIDNYRGVLKDPTFDTIRTSMNTVFLRESEKLTQSTKACYGLVLGRQYDKASEVLKKYPTPLIKTSIMATRLLEMLEDLNDQRNFESYRSSSWKRYQAEANEIRKSQIFNETNAWTSSNYSSKPIRYWRGTIRRLSTDKGGSKVEVAVESKVAGVAVEYRTSMALWSDESTIQSGSLVYDQLADINVGDDVFFSFSFIPDEDRGVREGSLTESGSMYNPEFIVKFSEILSTEQFKRQVNL